MKIFIYQTLIAFFHTGNVLGDSPDRKGLLAKKEVSDVKGFFFSVNIFIIKQTFVNIFVTIQNS